MSEKGTLHELKRGTRTSEPYDSMWERDYMLLLDADATVKRWERCRSLRIPYTKADGSQGRYSPDFIVEREDGPKELHEVKGGHLLAAADTPRKFVAGEAFCRARGMNFRVVTKSFVNPELWTPERNVRIEAPLPSAPPPASKTPEPFGCLGLTAALVVVVGLLVWLKTVWQ
jgi:hypothetical protein